MATIDSGVGFLNWNSIKFSKILKFLVWLFMNVLSVHFVKQLFGQTYRANIIRNVSEEDFPFFGNISYKLFLFSTFTTNEHPPNTTVDEKT